MPKKPRSQKAGSGASGRPARSRGKTPRTAQVGAGVLGRLLQHAVAVQGRAVDRLLRPDGGTRIQLGVIQHASNSGVPMGTLAERLGCHVSNLTGVVDRMQAQGLVRRQRAPRDRRSILIRLTSEGEALRGRLGLAVGDLQELLVGALSAAESRQLCSLLEKYIAGAEQQAAAAS